MSDSVGDLAIADRAAGSAAAGLVEPAGEEFFDALRRGDETRAVALALGLLDGGVEAQAVLLRIVVPASNGSACCGRPRSGASPRNTPPPASPTVLAGGPGFGADGRWARRLGADAWAPSAASAIELLDTMPWSAPLAAGDDLAVADSGVEYAGLRLRRARLVVAGIEGLRGGSGGRADPPVRSGTGLTDSGLDDDLGHVADFLSAAAYVHDPELFTDHITWLASVAAHLGAAPAALHAVLDAFRPELDDLPFALSCLDAGHVVLDRAGYAC